MTIFISKLVSALYVNPNVFTSKPRIPSTRAVGTSTPTFVQISL